jgi:hypothetical protein
MKIDTRMRAWMSPAANQLFDIESDERRIAMGNSEQSGL